MIKNSNRTKIIATVGPASADITTLTNMVREGVNVFRLNFSHGNHESHLQVIKNIKKINDTLESNIGILADLQGPKIRIGELKEEHISIEEGEEVLLTTKDKKGTREAIPVDFKNFAVDVSTGDKILIDDGKIELKTISTNGKDEVLTEVVYGGNIKPRKGINLPDTNISIPSLTEKDYNDLEFIVTQQLNWLALSFVRSADDVNKLREYLRGRDEEIKIIAKIEKPEAVENIESIIKASDAIMIARGDLGVEVPMERTPWIQKDIVNKCLVAAKPVIIATQMMESMIESSRPTRAEVSDVANAVIDGADALMLSAETASGKYPTVVIKTMVKIIKRVEKKELIYNKEKLPSPASPTYLSDAICFTSARLAQDVNAKAIIGMTISGYTAFLISSFRPKAKIFIFTENRRLLNTLSLVWGARGFYYDKFVSTDHTIADVKQILKAHGYVTKGDVIINSASMPLHEKGRTNMVKISVIK